MTDTEGAGLLSLFGQWVELMGVFDQDGDASWHLEAAADISGGAAEYFSCLLKIHVDSTELLRAQEQGTNAAGWRFHFLQNKRNRVVDLRGAHS